MSDWIDIGALDAIPQRGARLVKTSQGCVAVFRTGADEVFALDNACPHKAGPLAEGIVHGTSVTCPLHNWVISLETGAATGADSGQVATYPARVEGGRILLDTGFLQSRSAETQSAATQSAPPQSAPPQSAPPQSPSPRSAA